MYANVNYLVNAWVSRNINELFCSRLSSFLVFLILEKKKISESEGKNPNEVITKNIYVV